MLACSGCTGSIRLEYKKDKSLYGQEENTLSDEIGSMMHLLSTFPFFKNIEEKNLDRVVGFFNLKKYQPGDIVIRKGDPGGKLFIIASGSINVLNDAGIIISVLDKGEVFGEMSLICNDAGNGNNTGEKRGNHSGHRSAKFSQNTGYLSGYSAVLFSNHGGATE